MAERVPDTKSFSGTVWFKITHDGVRVIPLTKEQMHDLAAQQKEYP